MILKILLSNDYNWFATRKVNLSLYGGNYIAVWKKQIIVGSSASEVEKLAKEKFGQDCKPLITYIPKNMDIMI